MICPTCHRAIPAASIPPAEALLNSFVKAWIGCFGFTANEKLSPAIWVRAGGVASIAVFRAVLFPEFPSLRDHHSRALDIEAGQILSAISTLPELPGRYLLKKDQTKSYARYALFQLNNPEPTEPTTPPEAL